MPPTAAALCPSTQGCVQKQAASAAGARRRLVTHSAVSIRSLEVGARPRIPSSTSPWERLLGRPLGTIHGLMGSAAAVYWEG